ncbi:uncharacterized protein J3D65DRAFT_663260 [Phyllosticta citribraziliensis]|uniref:Rhodopsin domain-containing protein n=1 Tax=Phyllosticta citribraziliensis TaxID=989973 RepID=A0ABR1M7W2_9PEZI
MLAHHESIIVEIWVEYVLGLFVMAMGLVARWKIGGAHLSWDDLFAAISIVLWTIDPALEQYIATKGTFVGVDASTAQNLSTAETSLLEKGSKALFAAWFIYVTLIWTLKGTVLGYYYRLTVGLWQQQYVKYMAVVCSMSWVAVVIQIFCRCTPVQRNWGIDPYVGDQCMQASSSLITLMILNIANEIGLVFIPITIIREAKLPFRRKATLALLLSSSFFIIICALLRGILGLKAIQDLVVSIHWVARETFVTVIVINVPVIWPLFLERTKTTRGSPSAMGGRISWYGPTSRGLARTLSRRIFRDSEGWFWGSSEKSVQGADAWSCDIESIDERKGVDSRSIEVTTDLEVIVSNTEAFTASQLDLTREFWRWTTPRQEDDVKGSGTRQSV